jgi:hypothetical protein
MIAAEWNDTMGMSGVDAPDKPNRYEGATVTPPSEDYRIIPLTQCQFTKVSPEDYEWLLQQGKWQARWDQKRKCFYAVHSVSPRYKIQMHRFILGLEKGNPRKGDHRNHDTLDNQRINLRIASNSQNGQNSKHNSKSISGLKGVTFDPSGRTKKPWRARIKVHGKVISLGRFDTKELAHQAYIEAAKHHFGEFACAL